MEDEDESKKVNASLAERYPVAEPVEAIAGCAIFFSFTSPKGLPAGRCSLMVQIRVNLLLSPLQGSVTISHPHPMATRTRYTIG